MAPQTRSHPMQTTLTAETEIFRENRTVFVDGIAFAVAKDQHRAAAIVDGMKGGQRVEAAAEYIRCAISSFEADPASSDYQRGYLAALQTVRDEAFTEKAA